MEVSLMKMVASEIRKKTT